MACLRFCKTAAHALAAGARGAPALARGAKTALTSARATVRNGNNYLRLGNGRLSLGPGKNHWNRMGKLKKKVLRFHVHIERRYAGVDNWVKGTNWTWWKRG